ACDLLCFPTRRSSDLLKVFWRKEVWRGMGSLKGVFHHGFCWGELPSLGYPFYILCLALLLSVGFFLDFRKQEVVWTPLLLALTRSEERRVGKEGLSW